MTRVAMAGIRFLPAGVAGVALLLVSRQSIPMRLQGLPVPAQPVRRGERLFSGPVRAPEQMASQALTVPVLSVEQAVWAAQPPMTVREI